METPLGSEALAGKVREEGWVVLEGVLDPVQCEAWLRAVDRSMAAAEVPFGPNEFLGRHTRRLFNLLARDPVFAEVPVHGRILDVVQQVLDDQCLLSSLTAIEMQPGETDQPIHADDGSIGLPKPHPPITCTAIWALTDFTEQNGATRLVPGSHLRERSPRAGDAPETERAVMGAGSVLLYHGSAWHGGGANRSRSRRVGIVANYCAGFLRQEECQLLALPREQVRSFPPALQRLVGYSTYRGLLGHVDQRDPAEWVDPEAETSMVWGRIRR